MYTSYDKVIHVLHLPWYALSCTVMPSQQLALQIASAALLKAFDLLQNFFSLTGSTSRHGTLVPLVSRVMGCQCHESRARKSRNYMELPELRDLFGCEWL